MANPANSTAYQLGDGRWAVDVTENKTLAAKDSGYVQNVIATGVTITLPATATQGFWQIRDAGVAPSGAATGAKTAPALVAVDPDAADTLAGLDKETTGANGKKLTSSAIGDELHVMNTGATDGGIITLVKGEWSRES